MAKYRLLLLRKRLIREPVLAESNRRAMDNMLIADHAEIVNDEVNQNSGNWYLPHHVVVHPEKPNKVHIVFD